MGTSLQTVPDQRYFLSLLWSEQFFIARDRAKPQLRVVN
jgi:hypothetical protein